MGSILTSRLASRPSTVMSVWGARGSPWESTQNQGKKIWKLLWLSRVQRMLVMHARLR